MSSTPESRADQAALEIALDDAEYALSSIRKCFAQGLPYAAYSYAADLVETAHHLAAQANKHRAAKRAATPQPEGAR